MLMTIAAISTTSAPVKCSMSPSWDRWKRSASVVSAIRVRISVSSAACSAGVNSAVSHQALRMSILARGMSSPASTLSSAV